MARRLILKSYKRVYTSKADADKLRLVADKNTCIYCAELSQESDHVPCVVITNILDIDEPHYLVPSCSECNGLLGSLDFHTLSERANYLLGRYKQKYKKLEALPYWGMAELGELDRTMRDVIELEQFKQERLWTRYEALEHRILMDDTDVYESDYSECIPTT